MAKLSGGGITSNKLVRPGVRSGPPNTNVINPRGVSQFGYAAGGRMMGPERYTGENTAQPVKQGTMPQVPLGNAVAGNVGGGGPGTGRTVYKSGFQGMHGTPVQGSSPAPRDTLSEYGRDMPSASMVRRP
jgi:hypothetical protein